MKKKTPTVFLSIAGMVLAACGPNQSATASQETATATDRIATQTDVLPTSTETIAPIMTATFLPATEMPEESLLYPGTVESRSETHWDVRVESYPNEDTTDLLLRISRGEDFTQEISLGNMQFGGYWEPPNIISDVSAIVFSDFERDDDPEIVLGIHTPGTNCCTVVVVLYFEPSSKRYMNTNALVNKWTLSPDLTDINGDGVDEIIRHNEEFYDAMWGVGSGAIYSPIQVIAFSDGELIDASAQFPSVIAEDAERLLNVIREYEDCSGLLWGCYLVQMYVLGKGNQGWQAFADSCGDDGDFYERQVERIETALREFGYIE